MGFIGNPPLQQGIGLFSQDTFTGDGSTTTFDLTNAAPDGGDNDIQVFVDNVRQQAGASNAYTLGFDGSSEFKRITFTSAPESGQTIFVLNPGTKNAQVIQSVSDNTITTAKVQDTAVTAAKLAGSLDLSSKTVTLGNDLVGSNQIVDDAISEEHLDATAITGHTELSEAANDSDILLIYDASAGTLKKVLKSNIAPAAPTVTSVTPTNVIGDGESESFTITGTGFTAGSNARLIGNDGSVLDFDTVVRDSATQITGTLNNSNSLQSSSDPYGVQVTNGGGISALLTGQINFDASPIFVTAAGSLGSFADGARTGMRVVINANDPDSVGNVTYEKQSGNLPAGLSLTTENSEGGIAVISGTATAVASDTTSNFTIRAVDAASNTTSRSFSITILAPVQQSFTSSGTFAVPSGLNNIGAVLVVAGGGGGAGGHCSGGGGGGGLVYMPNYPVTSGGTITVTVGSGGSSGSTGQDSAFGSPGDPGLGQGGALTAKGGGSNGTSSGAGGSGGGGKGPGGNTGGTATQPTQPGNSGAYGFGNNGGNGSPRGGGGGGAGAAGSNSHPTNHGGAAGAGKSYTIADGTTSVGYAGGGTGGGANTPIGAACAPTFGGGVGGAGQPTSPGGSIGQAGTANRGGGGGGGGCGTQTPGANGAGGKGIVIISY